MSHPTLLCNLGRMGYREAWDLQAALQARLIAAKRAVPAAGSNRSPEARPGASSPEASGALPPHVLLLVEHPPVFTLGKSGDAANLLASGEALEARGATYVETDRGGDITFHGPGQVVAYPILDLDRLSNPEGEPLRDLHRFLREMEEAVIRTCADWGVEARRVPGRTGVWVGPDARGDERKVCAMGVRCSRWVTMHGLALNVSTDLDWFDLIVPCGIDDRGVTTLAREASGAGINSGEAAAPVTPEAVSERLVVHLAERLGLDVQPVSRADVLAMAQ